MSGGVGETNPNVIQPAKSVTFVFSIDGTGLDDNDFIQPNENGYLGAAKFVNGPGDDSAFGAVPEPSTGLLLIAGLAGLGAWRRAP
ncbi:MAG: PEP-CTERM sorting domain-containing protein [Deltaproteobacteria bacterium]|nr:PEP-CTERM sorting domain-containing protein [Deltaproteobacteria bacterium]MBW2418111.1 PEP-CTERM sorting domain-containing protein [Deltaproteobacteria bacterium]